MRIKSKKKRVKIRCEELVNSNTITLILLLDIPGGEYENGEEEGRKMDTIFSVVLLPN